MRSLTNLKNEINLAVKPNSVTDLEWEKAIAWAVEALLAKQKGQCWSHNIELPCASCVNWFVGTDGECMVGDWNYIAVNQNFDNTNVILEIKAEFENQEEWNDAALAALELAYATNAKEFWVEAGLLMLKAGLHKGALEVLIEGTRRYPSCASLYGAKAKVYLGLGWVEQSLDQLDTALAFEPLNTTWWSRKAELYWKLGQYNNAIRLMKHACSLPEVRQVEQQAYVSMLLKIGDFTIAYELLMELHKNDPTNAINWLLLARWASSNDESSNYVKEYYTIAKDLGHKQAKRELDYYLIREARKSRKRYAA